MPTTWLEQAWAIVCKDVVLEARNRTTINAMLFFAGMMLLIFSFALGPSATQLRLSAGGLLWLAFIFSGMLAFGHIYQLEAENSAFEGLLLVARNRSAIYLGKMLGVTAVMMVIELMVFPIMGILYSLDLWRFIPALLPVVLLGTVGFASIGALYGALTMSLRAREVLLPLLLLPITVPVVLAAVKATTQILLDQPDNLGLWIQLLVIFDVVFVTTGLLTFEYVAGE